MAGPTKNIDRREFIAGAGALLGAAIHARSQTNRSIMTNDRSEKKLGLALLGLGRYATGQLRPALSKTEHCELVGIVTGTPAKATQWTADLNLDRRHVYDYETMDRLADDPAIDIVYVVTPPALHPEFVIRAARAGKHVISEKPMATSVADCDRMIRACREAKVQLGIGYRLHYDPYYEEMERAARAKQFGEFRRMSGGFGYVLGQREMRITKALSGGGALMDVGIYVVNSACRAAGATPIYVTAHEDPKEKPHLFNEVEETIRFTLEFPKDTRCDGFASFNRAADNFHVEGRGGFMDFQQAFSYQGISCNTSRGPLSFPDISRQAAQMDDFAVCVREGRKSKVSGEMGRRDLVILLAIYEAARSGKRVKVEGI